MQRAKALRELGRIERTLPMIEWYPSPALRRRFQAGFNKGEAAHRHCNVNRTSIELSGLPA